MTFRLRINIFHLSTSQQYLTMLSMFLDIIISGATAEINMSTWQFAGGGGVNQSAQNLVTFSFQLAQRDI